MENNHSCGIKSKLEDLGWLDEDLYGWSSLEDTKKLKRKILAMLLPFYGIIA